MSRADLRSVRTHCTETRFPFGFEGLSHFKLLLLAPALPGPKTNRATIQLQALSAINQALYNSTILIVSRLASPMNL